MSLQAITEFISRRIELSSYWLSVAKENGIQPVTFYQRKRKLRWSDEKAATTKTMKRGRPKGDIMEYAVYKGDDLIVVGTATECAEFLGVKKHTIYWYASPSAENRITRAIRLENDDD